MSVRELWDHRPGMWTVELYRGRPARPEAFVQRPIGAVQRFSGCRHDTSSDSGPCGLARELLYGVVNSNEVVQKPREFGIL